MPNYIRNKLVIGSRVSEVLDFVKSAESLFDFNKICPRPEGLDITEGSLGDDGMEYLTLVAAGHPWGQKKAEEIKTRLEKNGYLEEALTLGKQYLVNIATTGHRTWYGWCCEHWGTKWNASEVSMVSDDTIVFTTAWSGVIELLEKLSAKFPDVLFRYKFSSEDTGFNCGRGIISNGTANMVIPVGGSKECYEIAFEMWPESKAYYKLVGDKYEYRDEDE